jgi:hypothetical protein
MVTILATETPDWSKENIIKLRLVFGSPAFMEP